MTSILEKRNVNDAASRQVLFTYRDRTMEKEKANG
jgi:hypothetical protein